jgi:membrane protein
LGAGGRQFKSVHPDLRSRNEPLDERHSRFCDRRIRDLSFTEWRSIFVDAGKRFQTDNGTLLASALAYSTFFAIPAVLLLAVGVFTLVTGPGTIETLMTHFRHVMPAQATSLLGGELHRLNHNQSASVVMTVVGGLLVLWSTTGAMTSYMTALNLAYERKDKRNFLKKRLVALGMVAAIGTAFLLVAVLLIFGPSLERLVAAHAGGASGAVGWIWWVAEWPILLVGLVAAFSTLLCLGPNIEHRRWVFITPGSVFATVMWLAVSGLFAVYTANFGSYNKTWGSLAAVIVMLTWLWLAAIALLLGAELNAETARRVDLAAAQTPPARPRETAASTP